jgi:hypothetical protein
MEMKVDILTLFIFFNFNFINHSNSNLNLSSNLASVAPGMSDLMIIENFSLSHFFFPE